MNLLVGSKVLGLGFTVSSKKLEHPDPHTPRGLLKGIPALIILKPCSNFLGFTVGAARNPKP